MLKEEKT
jgi:hypothetical protein